VHFKKLWPSYPSLSLLCITYFYDTFVTIQFFSIIYTYSKRRRESEKKVALVAKKLVILQEIEVLSDKVYILSPGERAVMR